MFRKIISLFVVISLCFGMSTSAFANTNSNFTILEDGIEKEVIYIGENKLILWNDDNLLYTEQYDLEGNLIESAVGNRMNGEIAVENQQSIYHVNASDIISTTDSQIIPTQRTYNKIATLDIMNRGNI